MIGENLRVLSNSTKVSAARPLLTAYIFFGNNGLHLRHLSFGACGLPNILATEHMPRQLRIADVIIAIRLVEPPAARSRQDGYYVLQQ